VIKGDSRLLTALRGNSRDGEWVLGTPAHAAAAPQRISPKQKTLATFEAAGRF
jgi:hypothetical protein